MSLKHTIETQKGIIIFWFRTDFFIGDNPTRDIIGH